MQRGSPRAAVLRWSRASSGAVPGASQCPLWSSHVGGTPRWSARGWLRCTPPIRTPGDRDGKTRCCRDGVTESSRESRYGGIPVPGTSGSVLPVSEGPRCSRDEVPKAAQWFPWFRCCPGDSGPAMSGLGAAGRPRAAGSSAGDPGTAGWTVTRRRPVPPVLGSARGGRERAARPLPRSQERCASPRGGARERGGRRRNRTANFPGAAGAGPWAAARAEHHDRRPRPPALPRAAAAAAARRALPRRRRRRWVRPDGQRGRGGRRRDSVRSCAESGGVGVAGLGGLLGLYG